MNFENNILRLWRADYTLRFESSSGMKRYHKDTRYQSYVATNGDNLTGVIRVIEKSIADSQTRLLQFHSAAYLGEVLAEAPR